MYVAVADLITRVAEVQPAVYGVAVVVVMGLFALAAYWILNLLSRVLRLRS